MSRRTDTRRAKRAAPVLSTDAEVMKHVFNAHAELTKARDALAGALRDREKLLAVILDLYESNDHSPISDARLAAREMLRAERLIP